MSVLSEEGADQEAAGAEEADWCRLLRFPKVLQVADQTQRRFVGGLLRDQRANPLERRDTLCRKLGRARLVLERVTRWR